MHGITKRFPGVLANDGVDFEAAAGEVHALLGENGAGKSTLSNILTGLYRPDDGRDPPGRRAGRASTRRATRSTPGIGMVHQHFRLVPPFTVAENIILGEHRPEARRFVVHPRADRARRRRARGERYGLAVDPRARIWQLSVGEQQRVEILKALYREARILILDEPTAVLTPQESEALFATLRRDGGGGPDGDLHLAQAARGEGGRRPRHRPARRTRGRRRVDDGRRDASRAGRADGRPRGRARRPGRARRAAGRRGGARGRGSERPRRPRRGSVA